MKRVLATLAIALASVSTGCPAPTADQSRVEDDDGAERAERRRERERCATPPEAIALANEGDRKAALDPNGAIESYQKANALAPKDHRILFKLAKAHEKKEEWDKVGAAMARACDIAPTFGNYWLMRAEALTRQAQMKQITYDEAIEPFKKCVAADPHRAACHAGLGRAYAATGRLQEALAAYTRAVEVNPTAIVQFVRLAEVYIQVGRFVEAREVLREALTFAAPRDLEASRVQLLLGDLALLDEDYPAAIGAYELAKSVDPTSAAALFGLGLAYAARSEQSKTTMMMKGFIARSCARADASPRCTVAAALTRD